MKNNRGKRASSVFRPPAQLRLALPLSSRRPSPGQSAEPSSLSGSQMASRLSWGLDRSPVTADSPSDSPRWTWPWTLRVLQGWGKPESVLAGLLAPAVAGSSFRAGDVSSSRKGVQGPCGCGVGGHVCVQKPQSRLHRINSTRKFWMFFSDGCH